MGSCLTPKSSSKSWPTAIGSRKYRSGRGTSRRHRASVSGPASLTVWGSSASWPATHCTGKAFTRAGSSNPWKGHLKNAKQTTDPIRRQFPFHQHRDSDIGRQRQKPRNTEGFILENHLFYTYHPRFGMGFDLDAAAPSLSFRSEVFSAPQCQGASILLFADGFFVRFRT